MNQFNMSPKYLPPISELRTSLKLRSKEYLRENSLHGFPYLMDPSKPTHVRVGWFICIIVSLAASVGTILAIWEKFQTSPTLMGLDILTDDVNIYYPNIYLCLGWELFQLENDSKLDPDLEPHFKELYNWNWDTSINSKMETDDYANFFEDLAPDCNDLLSNCHYTAEGCDIFHKVVTPAKICCGFEGKLLKREDSERKLQFDVKKFPMQLYMTGEHDETLSPIDGPLHELVTGSQIKFDPITTLTKKDVRFLSHNQRQCSFTDEVDSYINCELDCLLMKIFSVCSCVPWFLSQFGFEECQPREYACLVQARKSFSPMDCDCYLSCDQTSYTVEKIDQYWDSVQINISLNRWPHLLYKRETSFGWVDLVVSFGGIAGFFLGYSLLTSFEFLYYFTLRTYCGAVLGAPRKGINILVKPAPNQSLKLSKRKVNLKKEIDPFQYEFVY